MHWKGISVLFVFVFVSMYRLIGADNLRQLILRLTIWRWRRAGRDRLYSCSFHLTSYLWDLWFMMESYWFCKKCSVGWRIRDGVSVRRQIDADAMWRDEAFNLIPSPDDNARRSTMYCYSFHGTIYHNAVASSYCTYYESYLGKSAACYAGFDWFMLAEMMHVHAWLAVELVWRCHDSWS